LRPSSSQADKDRGYEAGCDDWRTKPLAVRNLKADLLVWKEEFDNAPRWEDGAGFDVQPDAPDAPDEPPATRPIATTVSGANVAV
jgi:DNA-binding response OmpR family regulator